jgi:ribosomal protein L27
MFKKVIVMAAVLGMAAQGAAQDGVLLARFDGAVGVDPVANVAGPANADGTFQNVRLNTVRGVNPAGPWTINSLKASIYTDGRIVVKGRGLVLAAGNSIGQTANQSVFATLICDTAVPFVERSTTLTGVPLDPNGDFLINDTLNAPASECASPVLLIRAASNGTWFAAALPKPVDAGQ